MASTTTLYRTADWTTAESAHGPTLAHWLRQELECNEGGVESLYGASFARWLRRLEEGRPVVGGDAFADFWTVDRWLTHVGLHPGQAPYGCWSADSSRANRRAGEAA